MHKDDIILLFRFETLEINVTLERVLLTGYVPEFTVDDVTGSFDSNPDFLQITSASRSVPIDPVLGV